MSHHGLVAKMLMLDDPLVRAALPTISSDQKRVDIYQYVCEILTQLNLPLGIFTFGSCPLKVYLPHGDIDIGVLVSPSDLERVYTALHTQLLQLEQHPPASSPYAISSVTFVNAEICVLKFVINQIPIDVSFNTLAGLSAVEFFDYIDSSLIQCDHLFKRTVLLLKLWLQQESQLLASSQSYLSSYSVEVLTLFVFNFYFVDISFTLIPSLVKTATFPSFSLTSSSATSSSSSSSSSSSTTPDQLLSLAAQPFPALPPSIPIGLASIESSLSQKSLNDPTATTKPPSYSARPLFTSSFSSFAHLDNQQKLSQLTPILVLFRFLHMFAFWDWSTWAITLAGPIPVSKLWFGTPGFSFEHLDFEYPTLAEDIAMSALNTRAAAMVQRNPSLLNRSVRFDDAENDDNGTTAADNNDNNSHSQANGAQIPHQRHQRHQHTDEGTSAPNPAAASTALTTTLEPTLASVPSSEPLSSSTPPLPTQPISLTSPKLYKSVLPIRQIIQFYGYLISFWSKLAYAQLYYPIRNDSNVTNVVQERFIAQLIQKQQQLSSPPATTTATTATSHFPSYITYQHSSLLLPILSVQHAILSCCSFPLPPGKNPMFVPPSAPAPLDPAAAQPRPSRLVPGMTNHQLAHFFLPVGQQQFVHYINQSTRPTTSAIESAASSLITPSVPTTDTAQPTTTEIEAKQQRQPTALYIPSPRQRSLFGSQRPFMVVDPLDSTNNVCRAINANSSYRLTVLFRQAWSQFATYFYFCQHAMGLFSSIAKTVQATLTKQLLKQKQQQQKLLAASTSSQAVAANGNTVSSLSTALSPTTLAQQQSHHQRSLSASLQRSTSTSTTHCLLHQIHPSIFAQLLSRTSPLAYALTIRDVIYLLHTLATAQILPVDCATLLISSPSSSSTSGSGSNTSSQPIPPQFLFESSFHPALFALGTTVTSPSSFFQHAASQLDKSSTTPETTVAHPASTLLETFPASTIYNAWLALALTTQPLPQAQINNFWLAFALARSSFYTLFSNSFRNTLSSQTFLFLSHLLPKYVRPQYFALGSLSSPEIHEDKYLELDTPMITSSPQEQSHGASPTTKRLSSASDLQANPASAVSVTAPNSQQRGANGGRRGGGGSNGNSAVTSTTAAVVQSTSTTHRQKQSVANVTSLSPPSSSLPDSDDKATTAVPQLAFSKCSIGYSHAIDVLTLGLGDAHFLDCLSLAILSGPVSSLAPGSVVPQNDGDVDSQNMIGDAGGVFPIAARPHSVETSATNDSSPTNSTTTPQGSQQLQRQPQQKQSRNSTLLLSRSISAASSQHASLFIRIAAALPGIRNVANQSLFSPLNATNPVAFHVSPPSQACIAVAPHTGIAPTIPLFSVAAQPLSQPFSISSGSSTTSSFIPTTAPGVGAASMRYPQGVLSQSPSSTPQQPRRAPTLAQFEGQDTIANNTLLSASFQSLSLLSRGIDSHVPFVSQVELNGDNCTDEHEDHTPPNDTSPTAQTTSIDQHDPRSQTLYGGSGALSNLSVPATALLAATKSSHRRSTSVSSPRHPIPLHEDRVVTNTNNNHTLSNHEDIFPKQPTQPRLDLYPWHDGQLFGAGRPFSLLTMQLLLNSYNTELDQPFIANAYPRSFLETDQWLVEHFQICIAPVFFSTLLSHPTANMSSMNASSNGAGTKFNPHGNKHSNPSLSAASPYFHPTNSQHVVAHVLGPAGQSSSYREMMAYGNNHNNNNPNNHSFGGKYDSNMHNGGGGSGGDSSNRPPNNSNNMHNSRRHDNSGSGPSAASSSSHHNRSISTGTHRNNGDTEHSQFSPDGNNNNNNHGNTSGSSAPLTMSNSHRNTSYHRGGGGGGASASTATQSGNHGGNNNSHAAHSTLHIEPTSRHHSSGFRNNNGANYSNAASSRPNEMVIPPAVHSIWHNRKI